jgi:hypothetical protein
MNHAVDFVFAVKYAFASDRTVALKHKYITRHPDAHAVSL